MDLGTIYNIINMRVYRSCRISYFYGIPNIKSSDLLHNAKLFPELLRA